MDKILGSSQHRVVKFYTNKWSYIHCISKNLCCLISEKKNAQCKEFCILQQRNKKNNIYNVFSSVHYFCVRAQFPCNTFMLRSDFPAPKRKRKSRFAANMVFNYFWKQKTSLHRDTKARHKEARTALQYWLLTHSNKVPTREKFSLPDAGVNEHFLIAFPSSISRGVKLKVKSLPSAYCR
jgi:hypothetical protein